MKRLLAYEILSIISDRHGPCGKGMSVMAGR